MLVAYWKVIYDFRIGRILGSRSDAHKQLYFLPYRRVNCSFGRICRLHLKGLRVSQARNQHVAGGMQSKVPLQYARWENG
jgi:hypothetical protein